MRIQPITCQTPRRNNIAYNQPAFNGLEKLTKKMPELGGSSYAELLKIYNLSKKFRLGLSDQDIQILEKYTGIDFVKKSFEYLCDKFWIPENIKPMLIVKEVSPNAEAAYLAISNAIFVKPQYLASNPNKEIFGAIRHEFEHFMQTIAILQHETYGPKYIDHIIDNAITMIKTHILNAVKDPNSPMLQQIVKNPNDRNLFVQVKMAHYNQDFKKIDEIFEKEKEKYRKNFTTFRKQIIERFGLVKEDSPRTEIVKKYFDGFKNAKYIKSDGTINNDEYLSNFTEREALKAQTRAIFEYGEEPCFIKFLKNNIRHIAHNSFT